MSVVLALLITYDCWDSSDNALKRQLASSGNPYSAALLCHRGRSMYVRFFDGRISKFESDIYNTCSGNFKVLPLNDILLACRSELVITSLRGNVLRRHAGIWADAMDLSPDGHKAAFGVPTDQSVVEVNPIATAHGTLGFTSWICGITVFCISCPSRSHSIMRHRLVGFQTRPTLSYRMGSKFSR